MRLGKDGRDRWREEGNEKGKEGSKGGREGKKRGNRIKQREGMEGRQEKGKRECHLVSWGSLVPKASLLLGRLNESEDMNCLCAAGGHQVHVIHTE